MAYVARKFCYLKLFIVSASPIYDNVITDFCVYILLQAVTFILQDFKIMYSFIIL